MVSGPKKLTKRICIPALLSLLSSVVNFLGFFLFFVLISVYYKYPIIEIYVIAYLLVIPYILSLLAIIFGIVALVKIRKNMLLKGKWMAVIGIILGILILLIFFLLKFLTPKPTLIFR